MVLLFRREVSLIQFCTIIMAKTTEKRTAKELFLKGTSQKEIAAIVKVQEKTISHWVKVGGWREERDARFNSSKNQIKQIKGLIAQLTERRINLIKLSDKAKEDQDLETLETLQKEANRISAEVANYNKTLTNLDKENRISLGVYIDVMQTIFKALQIHNQDLYMKTLDFQDEHITETSLKLG